MKSKTLASLFVMCLMVVAGAAPSAVVQDSARPYSKKLDELRALFNRDKGKVRLLVLLSPT